MGPWNKHTMFVIQMVELKTHSWSYKRGQWPSWPDLAIGKMEKIENKQGKEANKTTDHQRLTEEIKMKRSRWCGGVTR